MNPASFRSGGKEAKAYCFPDIFKLTFLSRWCHVTMLFQLGFGGIAYVG